MNYKIRKIPENNQDRRMQRTRYEVSLENKTFICKKLYSRPDHIYFSEKTQEIINSEILDKIEKEILKLK